MADTPLLPQMQPPLAVARGACAAQEARLIIPQLCSGEEPARTDKAVEAALASEDGTCQLESMEVLDQRAMIIITNYGRC